MGGAVFCAACGSMMHHDANSVRRGDKLYLYRYAKCKAQCSPRIPADEIVQLAEETFLRELGDREVRERIWVPGDDQQAAIAEAVQAVDELSEAAGRASSAIMRERLQRQLDALDRRLAELEATPAREARWEWRTTGGTFGEAWQAEDTLGRRALSSVPVSPSVPESSEDGAVTRGSFISESRRLSTPASAGYPGDPSSRACGSASA